MLKLTTFDLVPARINARLRARITPVEVFALLLAFGMALGFASLDATHEIGAFPDYQTFLKTADGVFASPSGGYFYAHSFRPVFSLLDLLPFYVGSVVWSGLNILGIWFAARVFNGNRVLALLNYQMLYVLYYGNIVGVIVGSLALMWWALHSSSRIKWELAGLFWAIAATKFQLGIPIGLALFLLVDATAFQRLRVVIVPLVVMLLSLIVYPDWVRALFQTMQTLPPNTQGNLSLWQYFGAITLLLWLPTLLPGLTQGRRLVLVACATALALPYFQQTDLLILFVLPVGAIPALLGNLGFPLFALAQWAGLKWLVLIPLGLYLTALRLDLSRFARPRSHPVTSP
jgi:hypothetical protein